MSESTERALSEKYADAIESGTGKVDIADLNSGAIQVLQSRAGMSSETIADYTELMRGGRGRGNTPAQFPPVRIYCVKDGEFYLTAGSHRWHAAEQAERTTLDAEFIAGTKQDAILDSVESNAKHGLRPTAKDVESSLVLLFESAKYRKMSDRALSRIIGCSPTTIGKARKALSTVDSEDHERMDANGRKLNTANIGKSNRKAEDVPVDDNDAAPADDEQFDDKPVKDEQLDNDDDEQDEVVTATRKRIKLPDDPTECEVAEVEFWLDEQDERPKLERFQEFWSNCSVADKKVIARAVMNDINDMTSRDAG